MKNLALAMSVQQITASPIGSDLVGIVAAKLVENGDYAGQYDSQLQFALPKNEAKLFHVGQDIMITITIGMEDK